MEDSEESSNGQESWCFEFLCSFCCSEPPLRSKLSSTSIPHSPTRTSRTQAAASNAQCLQHPIHHMTPPTKQGEVFEIDILSTYSELNIIHCSFSSVYDILMSLNLILIRNVFEQEQIRNSRYVGCCHCIIIAIQTRLIVVKRWPVILTGIVNTLHKRNHDLVLQLNKSSSDALQEEISEGTAIIERISGIKSEMGRDKPLKYVRYTNFISIIRQFDCYTDHYPKMENPMFRVTMMSLLD
jgi:hypothetical protein